MLEHIYTYSRLTAVPKTTRFVDKPSSSSLFLVIVYTRNMLLRLCVSVIYALLRQGVLSPWGSLYFSRCKNKIDDILLRQRDSRFSCCKDTVKIFRLCAGVAAVCFVRRHSHALSLQCNSVREYSPYSYERNCHSIIVVNS